MGNSCCSDDYPRNVYVEPAPPPAPSAPYGFTVPQPMASYAPPPTQYQPPPPPNYGEFRPGYRWMPMTAGQSVPHTAMHGGRDVDGSEIYVGRAFHEGDMLPAKVIPQKNVAYVAHGGQEHPKYQYEVLCHSEFQWEHAGHGSVPPNAVVAGNTSGGEPLYVGRAYYNGSHTVGKVQQSHGCLYIPFDGQEISIRDYEVLVMN